MAPKRNPATLTQPDGENLLLFNPATGALRQSNCSGRFIWSMCDGKHSLEDIVRAMIAAYDVDPDTARMDVLSLIDALEDGGFVESTSGKEEDPVKRRYVRPVVVRVGLLARLKCRCQCNFLVGGGGGGKNR